MNTSRKFHRDCVDFLAAIGACISVVIFVVLSVQNRPYWQGSNIGFLVFLCLSGAAIGTVVFYGVYGIVTVAIFLYQTWQVRWSRETPRQKPGWGKQVAIALGILAAVVITWRVSTRPSAGGPDVTAQSSPVPLPDQSECQVKWLPLERLLEPCPSELLSPSQLAELRRRLAAIEAAARGVIVKLRSSSYPQPTVQVGCWQDTITAWARWEGEEKFGPNDPLAEQFARELVATALADPARDRLTVINETCLGVGTWTVAQQDLIGSGRQIPIPYFRPLRVALPTAP